MRFLAAEVVDSGGEFTKTDNWPAALLQKQFRFTEQPYPAAGDFRVAPAAQAFEAAHDLPRLPVQYDRYDNAHVFGLVRDTSPTGSGYRKALVAN